MEVKDLLKIYKASPLVSLVTEKLKDKEKGNLFIKNSRGSFDALLASCVYQANKKPHLFILRDREEAAYFQNDLENMLGKERNVQFFPTSYKRPYIYDEIENANVLQRAEVLNTINSKSLDADLIVTYPQALIEKVINKRSLVKNTFGVKVGDSLDLSFMSELLVEYGFQMNDFVYEAGDFSIRGGIIDIYSFANELPYRIELLGKEVESIRTFDPESQLSVEKKKSISIIPDVQTKLLEETRQSFLEYIPSNTTVWIKDYPLTIDVIEKSFEKVSDNFEDLDEGIW